MITGQPTPDPMHAPGFLATGLNELAKQSPIEASVSHTLNPSKEIPQENTIVIRRIFNTFFIIIWF
jgi:hypothetical protein